MQTTYKRKNRGIFISTKESIQILNINILDTQYVSTKDKRVKND